MLTIAKNGLLLVTGEDPSITELRIYGGLLKNEGKIIFENMKEEHAESQCKH